MPRGVYKRTEEHKKKMIKNLNREGNKGKSFSSERKANLMKTRWNRQGIYPSIDTRRKMAKSHKGSKSHLWRGGLTPINKRIRNSLEYKLWRAAVFARDNWICRFCGQRGGNLHADHIKSFSLYPELRFAIDNGRTLCVSCHRKTFSYLRNVISTRKTLVKE